jgi:cytochrome bd-type quinol oxidase subunit 2
LIETLSESFEYVIPLEQNTKKNRFMNDHLFSTLPLWVIYIIIVSIILSSVRSGIAFAQWRKKRVKHEDESSINTLVGSTLGLLAFILAFTFSLSSSRFDARKQFLLEEVNSIETSWLRAGLVEEPYNSLIKKALKEYVEVRIWLIDNPDKVKEGINNSSKIQNTIWMLITDMNQKNIGKDIINATLIEATNDMFDNQTKRIAKGVHDRIPNLIWIALFALIIIAMFQIGYLLGKSKKSNWALVLALSMSFSIIIIIIVDLDSSKGNITINHQAMYDMYDRIK